MLGQLNIYGKTKIDVAIDRIKSFEPRDGYYLAFSGGKDSIVVKSLMIMAGVNFESNYNNTTVDPPELIKFIKNYHPDTIINNPTKTMWQLIPEKLLPPTRLMRYCCDELKEGGGIGRFVVTGVRWAESARRKNNRTLIEFDRYGSQSKKAIENRRIFLMSDNEYKRMMLENCTIKGKHILNPIIDWSDKEVWEFIRHYNIPYPTLYDEGYNRLGCIGCPMAPIKQRLKEFKRYPKQKINYIKAFDRMIKNRNERGLLTSWKNGQEVFDWWISS